MDVEYYTWDSWTSCNTYSIAYLKKHKIQKIKTSFDESKGMVRVEIQYENDEQNGSVG